MDLDQELAGEALEYACFHDCGPVLFWLLYKYFSTNQLLNNLSGCCKKRVSCHLMYWVVKESKVSLFNLCLTILHLLKDNHPDVCSQKEWAKLQLGIKLKIVLQQMLNGSSQSQCLETFYEQFPDFEKDETEFSYSEDHMLQLLFQLIQRPSVALRDDTFQNEVGSKLIHAIRHRVKHVMVKLNQILPQPKLEKTRLDMLCTMGKQVEGFERFSERKQNFCKFLQKTGKPTSRQLLQFLEGNMRNELSSDIKVEVVERVWYNVCNDLSSFAKTTYAKGTNCKRMQPSIPIRDIGKSNKLSFYCQDSVDVAKETKLASGSCSSLKSSEILKQHKSDATIQSVTRLRSSSSISKVGRENSLIKSTGHNFMTGPPHVPGKRALTAPASTLHDVKSQDGNFCTNSLQGHSEGDRGKNVDFLAEFRQHSDLLRGQIDGVAKLINECINSNSYVKLKKFKSPERLVFYGKQEGKNCRAVLENEQLVSDVASESPEKCSEKIGSQELIVRSDSEEKSPRYSLRLRRSKQKSTERHGNGMSVCEDIKGTRIPRQCSDSSVNSSQNLPASLSTSENFIQSRNFVTADFTDCRERDWSKSETSGRESFNSRSDSEMQRIQQKRGVNNLFVSSETDDVSRKRRKSDKKSSEEKENRALTLDSDGKESSEEIIVVGSSYSQSFHKIYSNDERICNKTSDDVHRSKMVSPRRRLRSTKVHRQVMRMAKRDSSSSHLEKNAVEGEKAERENRSSAHQQSPESSHRDTMEKVSVFRDSQKECCENIDGYGESPISTHKASDNSRVNTTEQLRSCFAKTGVSSPVFEYKHSSGSSSGKSVSLLTGRRVLFTPDEDLIPNVSIPDYPINLSELSSLSDGQKNHDNGESNYQVGIGNSSNSHISSDVNSDQVKIISETPPESPDGNKSNSSPLEVCPSGGGLILRKSDESHSDSSSLQHAQRQQTHSFSKSSSDDLEHVSDSEDEEDSPGSQNSQNHPRFPSLVQYLNDKAEASPLRSCSIVLQKLELDKLRLRVLLSQDSQGKN